MKKQFTLFVFLTLVAGISNAQNWLWADNFGGNGPDQYWDIHHEVDANGNVYVAGEYSSSSITFGSFTLNNVSSPSEAGFLVKYDAQGNVLWADGFSGDDNVNVYDIEVSPQGSAFVVGSFSGTFLNFSNGDNITQQGSETAYIARWAPNGAAVWTSTPTHDAATTYSSIRAISMDGNGHIIMGGRSDNILTWNGFSISNANDPDEGSWLVKANPQPSGPNILWVADMGFFSESTMRIAVYPNNDFLVTTSFRDDTVIINQDSLFLNGSNDILMIKADASGNPLWAREVGGSTVDEIKDVHIDWSGATYIVGGFGSPFMIIGNDTLTNGGMFNLLVMKLDSAGNFKWAKAPSTAGIRYATGVAAINNKVFLTGIYGGTGFSLGNGVSVSTQSTFSAFLARLDSAGNGMWVRQPTSSDSLALVGLNFSPTKDLVFLGSHRGVLVNMDTVSIGNSGNNVWDHFVGVFGMGCNLTTTITNITDATCGDNNGEATVSATGGMPPYSYVWSNSDTTATADSLSSGMYQVVVTDANGCAVPATALISNTGAPSISISSTGTSNVTCNGGNNGTIDIDITGGSPPYDISWSNGQTTETITNLTAGTYDVSVTDTAGCTTMMSIPITEPDSLSISVSTTNASCGLADGSATVTVSGGTAPYNYNWSSGGTTATENNLAVGSYEVYISDTYGCTDSAQVMISEVTAPTVTIDSVFQASCSTGGGSIYISVTGGTAPYTYSWSNGATTQDLTGALPGWYWVNVEGANGCHAMVAATITYDRPVPPEICLVSVDSATGNNLVVWEKPVTNLISHYNIYQEMSVANQYVLVGQVPYANISEFVDTTANPLVRSYRYKITSVDTCGIESLKSDYHKTIHLGASFTTGNDVFCSWSHYEGFWFGSYNVYRYSDAFGWEQMNPQPSTNDSWTDLGPPTSGQLYYVLEAIPPSTCVSTRANNHNTTRSNRYQMIAPPEDTTSVENHGDKTKRLNASVYPNPSSGQFTLVLDPKSNQTVRYQVFDIYGRLIMDKNLGEISTVQEQTLDLTSEADGQYLIRILTDNQMITGRIIKQ